MNVNVSGHSIYADDVSRKDTKLYGHSKSMGFVQVGFKGVTINLLIRDIMYSQNFVRTR